WAFDRLVLETRERSQATFVEQLGGEGGDVRMEPPRLLEEKARIGRDGRGVSEQVLQSRDRRSVWMGSLDGLLELAGVTEEDDALRRGRDRERAGERQLAGFVDDENVHGVLVLLAGPEPGGAAEDVDGTGPDGGERLGIVLELDDLARA